MPRGSKHDLTSTHDRVVRAAEACFLALIAVDPDVPPPGRPRWFGLDGPAIPARLAARPRAPGWVVATDDLDGLVASSPVDLGEIVGFTRGSRSWRLTVPRDGSLCRSGLVPAFIAWSPAPHPSLAMDDPGPVLRQVVLTRPRSDALRAILSALGIAHLAGLRQGEEALAFAFDTPNGRVVMD